MTRTRTARMLVATVAVGLTTLVLPAAPAVAREPGTPVPTVPQFDQSANGGTNPKVGTVPSTASIGRPDAGVVPVVGKADARADDGASVLYESRVTDRVVDLMVQSPGLRGNTPVRLHLPNGYDASSSRRWPVLYLLPGASDKADYQAWSLYTDTLAWAADKDVIVAMPSGGKTGLGTNWNNGGRGAAGGYQWNTYLAQELPQLLERGYAASGNRAVAGISTGGFTALSLVAQNPGRYGAAASFSGLNAISLSYPFVSALLLREGVSTDQPWGSYWFQRRLWDANDPTNSPEALKGAQIFVSNGNGRSGPLDGGGFFSWDGIESLTLSYNTAFITALRLKGVAVTSDLYGNGTHSWPYWSRELKKAWPQLAAGLGLG